MESAYSIGIAFPGPETAGKWYSNNLTEDFRAGVKLPYLMKLAFESYGIHVGKIFCRLDAQADAGAEVYHPRGRLVDGRYAGAIVLNLATGIAAGVVNSAKSGVKGRVLSDDQDFSFFLGKRYDRGAGQLGRHVLFSPGANDCHYDFKVHGGTASASGKVRLSEYLSGPALVSRFRFVLDEKVPDDVDTLGNLKRYKNHISTAEFCERLIFSNRQIREDGGQQVKELIDLLNRSIVDVEHSLHRYACYFRDILLDDFRNLFSLLGSLDGWKEFSSTIVITGGVGQNLFAKAGTDLFEDAALHSTVRPSVMRSILADGCERAAYYFFALASEQ